MFSCCTSYEHEEQFADRIKPCPIHHKEMLFVCKNTATCLNNALFCTSCADDHKGHDFQTVNNFFTPELTRLVTQKTKGKE